MKRKSRIALCVFGGLLALFVFAAILLAFFVDANAHKPRLETAASEALGMEVRVGGRLGIGIFPGLQATLEDLLVRSRGTDLLAAKKASLRLELLPLLRGEIRIGRIGLQGPRIGIRRDADGRFNFEGEEKAKEGARPSWNIGNISLSNATVTYEDRMTGKRFHASGADLEIVRLEFPGGESADPVKNLSFSAEVSCKELGADNLSISGLKLRIDGKDGTYGIRPAAAAHAAYTTREGKVTADRLSVGAVNISFADGDGKGILRRMSLSGNAGIGEIRTKDLAISGLAFTVAGKGAVFDFQPVTMRIFGGEGSGGIRADFSGSVPRYHVRYTLSKFRFEEFLKILTPKKFAVGPLDFTANLSMRGSTAAEWKRTSEGEASLQGENLVLQGFDLDRMLSRLESSRNFNLVDVGAFFFAGPFGPALTKGYNFATIYEDSGGSGSVRRLVSRWKVERGVAHAADVAMATHANRIALKGSLDFPRERFNDITVAWLDGKGCAKARQRIRGSFHDPEVEKVSVLQTVAGPVIGLLKRTKDILTGGRCEVFYSGSVPPP